MNIVSIVLAALGALLIWAAIKNVNPLTVIKDVTKGKAPVTSPEAIAAAKAAKIDAKGGQKTVTVN